MEGDTNICVKQQNFLSAAPLSFLVFCMRPVYNSYQPRKFHYGSFKAVLKIIVSVFFVLPFVDQVVSYEVVLQSYLDIV